MADAETQSHSASNPLSASAQRTCSKPEWSSPGTFSMTMYRGRCRRATRRTSRKRPLRAPLTPCLEFLDLLAWRAVDTSWQGNEAQRMSTGSASGPMAATSLYWWTPGKCVSRMSRRNGFCSATQRVVSPHFRAARSHPPIPENIEPTVFNSPGSWSAIDQEDYLRGSRPCGARRRERKAIRSCPARRVGGASGGWRPARSRATS